MSNDSVNLDSFTIPTYGNDKTEVAEKKQMALNDFNNYKQDLLDLVTNKKNTDDLIKKRDAYNEQLLSEKKDLLGKGEITPKVFYKPVVNPDDLHGVNEMIKTANDDYNEYMSNKRNGEKNTKLNSIKADSKKEMDVLVNDNNSKVKKLKELENEMRTVLKQKDSINNEVKQSVSDELKKEIESKLKIVEEQLVTLKGAKDALVSEIKELKDKMNSVIRSGEKNMLDIMLTYKKEEEEERKKIEEEEIARYKEERTIEKEKVAKREADRIKEENEKRAEDLKKREEDSRKRAEEVKKIEEQEAIEKETQKKKLIEQMRENAKKREEEAKKQEEIRIQEREQNRLKRIKDEEVTKAIQEKLLVAEINDSNRRIEQENKEKEAKLALENKIHTRELAKELEYDKNMEYEDALNEEKTIVDKEKLTEIILAKQNALEEEEKKKKIAEISEDERVRHKVAELQHKIQLEGEEKEKKDAEKAKEQAIILQDKVNKLSVVARELEEESKILREEHEEKVKDIRAENATEIRQTVGMAEGAGNIEQLNPVIALFADKIHQNLQQEEERYKAAQQKLHDRYDSITSPEGPKSSEVGPSAGAGAPSAPAQAAPAQAAPAQAAPAPAQDDSANATPDASAPAQTQDDSANATPDASLGNRYKRKMKRKLLRRVKKHINSKSKTKSKSKGKSKSKSKSLKRK
jgi:hypothetical protein